MRYISDYPKHLCKTLRALRAVSDRTIHNLCAEMGVSAALLSSIENESSSSKLLGEKKELVLRVGKGGSGPRSAPPANPVVLPKAFVENDLITVSFSEALANEVTIIVLDESGATVYTDIYIIDEPIDIDIFMDTDQLDGYTLEIHSGSMYLYGTI